MRLVILKKNNFEENNKYNHYSSQSLSAKCIILEKSDSPRRNFGSGTVFFGSCSRVNKNCFPYHFKGMSTWMEWM